MFYFTFCDSVIMVSFLVYFALGFITARSPSTYLEPYLDSKAWVNFGPYITYEWRLLFSFPVREFLTCGPDNLFLHKSTLITCLFWYNFHSDQTTSSSSTCIIFLVKMCIMMCVLPALYASKIEVQKKKTLWPFLNENFPCYAPTYFLEFQDLTTFNSYQYSFGVYNIVWCSEYPWHICSESNLSRKALSMCHMCPHVWVSPLFFKDGLHLIRVKWLWFTSTNVLCFRTLFPFVVCSNGYYSLRQNVIDVCVSFVE